MTTVPNRVVEEAICKKRAEEVEQVIAETKKAIAESPSGDPVLMQDRAMGLTWHCGKLDACRWMERLMGSRMTDIEVAGRIIRKLCEGADDRWSGRGNDFKRMEFDGFREEIQSLWDRCGLDY